MESMISEDLTDDLHVYVYLKEDLMALEEKRGNKRKRWLINYTI